MSTACKSIYVHVPFCRTLCGYCDFYSSVPQAGQIRPLVDALLRELDAYAGRMPIACDTLYVGGGTPTVLPTADLARLLDRLHQLADPAAEVEFTVEANPATVTRETAGVLVAAGVNRVSLGAQSFDPAELAALDRRHAPADVGTTVATCRAAGIAQISLDLIFGVPGQTLDSWQASLGTALALSPDHLSCYGLTYEPGTPLHERLENGLVQRVDEDVDADLYDATLDRLPAAGLRQYEISNFARPGAECRHNLRYWHNEPYLGIGPSAAGYLGGVRYKNIADTAAYVDTVTAGRSPWAESEQLPPTRQARETAMLELRLTAGIDRRRFAERYGLDPVKLFAPVIERHLYAGLLAIDSTSLRLTRPGLLVADSVMADFL